MRRFVGIHVYVIIIYNITCVWFILWLIGYIKHCKIQNVRSYDVYATYNITCGITLYAVHTMANLLHIALHVGVYHVCVTDNIRGDLCYIVIPCMVMLQITCLCYR